MHKIAYLAGLLEKKQKKMLRWFGLLCLVSPVVNLFSVSMIIPIFQQAFDQEVSPQLLMKIVLLSVVLLLTGVFELLKNRSDVFLVTEVSESWSAKIYELYCKEDLHSHNEKTVADACNGVRMDPSVCASMIPTVMNLLADALTLAAYFLVIIYVSRGIGVVSCLLILAIMALLYSRTRIKMTTYGKTKRKWEIRASGLVSTAFGSYKEIKIDNRKGNILEKYRGVSWNFAQTKRDYALITGLQGIVLQNVMQSGIFLFLALVLATGAELTRILPQAVVYLTLMIRLIPASKVIVSSLTTLQYGSKYFESFQQDMERFQKMKKEEAERAALREKKVTLKQGIKVRNLSFRYPNGKQIFDNVSLDIPAGAAIAVVGPSGEGKTTFLDLILGLLHPQSGHIWYDDYDIVEGRDGEGPCQADVGSIVSYIPQIIYLNNETLRENVVFMADEGERDEAKVIECLKCAQIWKDVQEMPHGLDTMIGQNGTTVSGGQRQRIALARALYKDFEILIMDEATAALDIETEKAVIDSVRQIKGSKTLLMVTHHRSLANECEHIYRLENRKLIQER